MSSVWLGAARGAAVLCGAVSPRWVRRRSSARLVAHGEGPLLPAPAPAAGSAPAHARAPVRGRVGRFSGPSPPGELGERRVAPSLGAAEGPASAESSGPRRKSTRWQPWEEKGCSRRERWRGASIEALCQNGAAVEKTSGGVQRSRLRANRASPELCASWGLSACRGPVRVKARRFC